MTVYRYVAEITVVTDGAGTTATSYFGTSGFATKPTDTPADTYVAARLKSAGSLRRELFSGNRVFGAVRPAYGELVLINADGGLDTWINYGISGGKVTVRYGPEDGAYPADYATVYIAYAKSLHADFSEVRIKLRDRLYLMERPMVTATFDGSGGVEGSSALVGTLKQWVSSDPGFIPPISLSPSSLIYYVQSTSPGSLAASFACYEGGVTITRGADYTTQADLIATSPSAGQCRFFFGPSGVGPVYVRLGSVPIFDVRVYALGHHTSGTAWTVASVASLAGITGGSGTVAIGALLVDDSRTYLDVCEESCLSGLAWFGMTAQDTLVTGQFSAPGVTAEYTLTQHNARDWQRIAVADMEAPVYSVTLRSGRTWPSNLASSVTGTMQDYLTRDPWWATNSSEQTATLTANPGALAEVIETEVRAIANSTQWTSFASAYFTLFGTRREFYTCEVPLTDDTLALELHDTVEILMPRFGLDAGKKFRVITQHIQCDRRMIGLGLWG